MQFNLATVFSGIGSIEQALKLLKIDYQIEFACDNGEIEISDDIEDIKKQIKGLDSKEQNKFIKKLYAQTGKHNYVKDSYFANYDISEDRWFDDIRFLNGRPFKNQIDLLVGGSPCQSFSIIGKRRGLEDTRGTLFYEYARLVNEMKPRAFIFENVPGMLSHDGGKTWDVISTTFKSLGYDIYYKILNSKDYGIPQDRKRLFVVGFRTKTHSFEFPKPVKLETTFFDYLDDNVDTRHYLGKKGFEFVTNPKYKNRARINPRIIQTQKANQQFNWNGDFVFVPYEKIKDNKDILNRAFIGTWNGKRGAVRQLSYRECYRLMGYPDSYKIVVPNVPAYRQAGNSIVVNVMKAVVNNVIEVLNNEK